MCLITPLLVIQAEIEKVKKRREERALEKAQHEEEMVCLVKSPKQDFSCLIGDGSETLEVLLAQRNYICISAFYRQC